MYDDSGDDLWSLLTEYSIHHAALLIAGFNPSEAEDCEERQYSRRFPGYLPAKTALCNAVEAKRLGTANLAYEEGFGNDKWLSIHRTTISQENLSKWLSLSGRACEAFNPRSETANQNMYGRGSYVSKKLVAANKAWEAVTSDPRLLHGKSPKQALQKWLVEHAEELGLLTKDGKPNQTGIEEICKVANWKPEGGATPTQQSSPPPPTIAPFPARRPAPSGGFGQRATGGDVGSKENFDLDDEIPF